MLSGAGGGGGGDGGGGGGGGGPDGGPDDDCDPDDLDSEEEIDQSTENLIASLSKRETQKIEFPEIPEPSQFRAYRQIVYGICNDAAGRGDNVALRWFKRGLQSRQQPAIRPDQATTHWR